MKKYLSAACAVLLGLMSVSCNEKEEALVMEVTPLELSIDPEGGNKTFTVKSNKDWTLVADKWITASTSGEKGSDVTVTVNLIAGKNSSTETRIGYVIIQAGGQKETLTVSQDPFVAPAGIYNASDMVDFAAALKEDEPDLSKWTSEDGVIRLYDDIDATSLSCFPMESLPKDVVLDGQDHTINMTLSLSPDAKIGMFKEIFGTVRNLSLAGSAQGRG